MTAVPFDTLKLARVLCNDAHMPAEQAEGVANALADAMSGAELATKADLREMELRLKHDLTLRLGGMLAASIAIVAALVKLIH